MVAEGHTVRVNEICMNRHIEPLDRLDTVKMREVL